MPEEVIIKTGFDGRERIRVLADSERERITGLYSKETEGLNTRLLSVEGGD